MIRRLKGVIQPYAWGSTTVIPELLGQQPTGEPQAELWLGAHPLAPALADGEPLDELVARDPEGLLGAGTVVAFGPRLPFLLKIIAAEQPLSLQAHPSRAQAEAGFAREQAAGVPRDAPHRIYRDGWPKPEVLCALVETEALCGFRQPAETFALFSRLGVTGALDLVAPLDDPTPAAERIGEVFTRLMRLAGDDRAIVDEVVQAAGEVYGSGPFGVFARTARQLGENYPRDPGVLAALLMNRVTLLPNDAIFLAAGNLHAYLRGAGVEIMANSDNVMRGGLTTKFVDVDELLSVLDFTPGVPDLVSPVELEPGVWHYPTPAPEFALWRVEGDTLDAGVPEREGARVVLVTAGSLTLASGGSSLSLGQGDAAFVAAGEDARLTGSGTAFVGGPGALAAR